MLRTAKEDDGTSLGLCFNFLDDDGNVIDSICDDDADNDGWFEITICLPNPPVWVDICEAY